MTLNSMNITKILDDNRTALNNNGTSSIKNITEIIRWITFGVGLPAVGFTIYLMGMQAKTGKAAPVYMMSLLASDIFNILGRPNTSTEETEITSTLKTDISSLIFYFGIISNIVFMVCVAQERYLLVSCPRYNACCTKLKQSSLISLVVWAAPFAILFLAYQGFILIFSIALLLPLPFLLFFFMDSWRALWCTKRPVPGRNKILVMQAVLLSNYSILYFPFALKTLLNELSLNAYMYYLRLIADLLLYLGPLVDPFLSLFLTNGVKEILKAFPCCMRNNPEQETNTLETVETVSGIVTRL